MDRKSFLIILVTIGILAGWQLGFYVPHMREVAKRTAEQKALHDAEKAKEPQPIPQTAGTGASPAPASPPSPTGSAIPQPVKTEPAIPEEKKTLASLPGTTEYEFTTLGGGIARGILREHFKDKSKGTQVVINEFGGIPIGALTEAPGEESLVKLPWAMSVDEASRIVSFERTEPVRQIKIAKKFILPRDKSLREEYVIDLDLTFTNVGAQAMMVPVYFLHTGSAAPLNASEQRYYQGFDWWRDGTNSFQNVDWFSAGGFLAWSHPERPEFKVDTDQIRWTGVTNQYFTTIVTLLGEKNAVAEELVRKLGISAWAKRTSLPSDVWREAGHSLDGETKLFKVDGAMGIPGVALQPGQSVTRHVQIYSGPREYRRLRLLDNKESDILDYGSFLGIPTGVFSKLLLNSMNGLYAWTGNYALAIVLLTICVKALLWPLQNRANKNMKKMSALQPKIKELQDKYKDDPVKFQQEMGKTWKKAGVNPLSGCWPVFIQVPIFIGFYNMLGKAVELRHHGFWWVKDLSQPDTIFRLGGFLSINPLPLIMAGTMLLQMKLTPQSGDPAQRKMMMFMPVIFIVMCYNYASALALYWAVQNVISIVQLRLNRNKNSAQPLTVVAK